MSSCEKCWGDAFMRAQDHPMKSQSEHYEELLEERKGKPCTPEEKAGPDAQRCHTCKRKTLHQYTGKCMNPACGDHE